MNWTDAYEDTKKGEIWGFFDIGLNFTQDTLKKYISQFISNSVIMTIQFSFKE